MRWCALLLGLMGAVTLGVWLAWPRMPSWVERRKATVGDTQATVLVVRLPMDGWRWELRHHAEHPKTVQDWRGELGADVVFNAAYFNDNNTPSGYLQVDGVTGAVAWPDAQQQTDPFGYTFLVAPGAETIRLAYLPASPQLEPASDAFLSFPTLVADGQPRVAENSGLYAPRTILAQTGGGDTYLIVTEKGSVTLYDMAQWLAAQPEDFVLAGNLDGGPSTGVSIENGNWDVEAHSARVPSVIAGYRVQDQW